VGAGGGGGGGDRLKPMIDFFGLFAAGVTLAEVAFDGAEV